MYMKKLATLLCALFVSGVAVNAMTLTNPAYMPQANTFMSDTEGNYKNTVDGDDFKVYTLTETLSYTFTDRLQLGAYIGYGYYDTADEKDFTNPGIFGFFRAINNEYWQFDVGGEVELNVFDGFEDSGVSDDVYKYSAMARTSVDLGVVSVGGLAKLGYWNGDGARVYNRDLEKNITYAEAKAFAIFDAYDFLGIGGEAGYKVYDATRDYDVKGYTLTARVDINPVRKNFGVVAYGTYENMEHLGDLGENYIFGAKVRVAI
jgi:hypothetical protein